MAKTGIDELLKTIETVKFLQNAVAQQQDALTAILERLGKIEDQLNSRRGVPGGE